MKTIGYIRVSTEEQSREGVSLDNQEAKIKAYADLNNLSLVEIIRDEGRSAKTLNREGLTRLLKLLDEGQAESVIVYKLDRLSRNTVDTLNIIDRLEKQGIAFHSINERIDTKSATGKFFLTILSALAQMERDLIAERTRDALAHKKSQGQWCGHIPYGFKIEDGKLVEEPDQMKAIKKAKRLHAEGKTYREISRGLGLSLGYVHKAINTDLRTLKASYSKQFSPTAVH